MEGSKGEAGTSRGIDVQKRHSPHIILESAEEMEPQGRADSDSGHIQIRKAGMLEVASLKTRVLSQHSEPCQNPRTFPQLRLVKRGISHLLDKLEVGTG